MRTSNIQRVRDENVKLREILLDCEKAVGFMDPCKTLVENIAALKSENERLRQPLIGLVSPTIELLEKVRQQAYLGGYWSDEIVLAREIERLRAACGEGGKDGK